MSEVRLQLLGRFQARRGGEEVPPAAFGGRKVRALLRVLAIRSPDLVTHDVLAEALWPDRLPADPAANLGVLVNRARRALGDPAVIVTGSGGYALGRCAVDVTEFLEAAERVRTTADDASATRAAEVALQLWASRCPEDTYADWAREPRGSDCCGSGSTSPSAPRISSWRSATRSVPWAGRRTPSRPIRCASPPCSSWRRRRPRPGTWRGRCGGCSTCGVGWPRSWAWTRPRPSTPCGSPCCAASSGRGRRCRPPRCSARRRGRPAGPRSSAATPSWPGCARRCAHAGWRRCPASPGRGSRGCSASSWVARRSRARRAGVPARADGGLGLAVDAAGGPRPGRRGRRRARPGVRSALADVLPELEDPGGASLDGESRRALILSGGLRIVAAAVGDGALLVVDDLQWADPSSLALLGSVLARLPRLAAVLAFRPDEIDPSVPAELCAGRTTSGIELGPLSRDAIGGLLHDPGLVEAVLATTDRTPFAVREVVRELLARDAITPGHDGGWTPRSSGAIALAAEPGRAGQAAAVRRRAARQAEVAAKLLVLLGLLAREAPASTLAQAAGLDQAVTLEALSGLAGAGLVRLGQRGWATAHDLVTETVTADLDDGERGRLHALLAGALPRRAPNPPRSRGTTARPGTPMRPPPRTSAPPAARSPGTPPARHSPSRPPASPSPPTRRRAPTCSPPGPRPGRSTVSPARSTTCAPPGRHRRRAAALPAPVPAGDADLRCAEPGTGVRARRARRRGRYRRRRRAGPGPGDRGHPRHEPRPPRGP